MKKTILKIFVTASTLIALFFIVFLVLTTFGRVAVEEFDNNIVRTICVVLGGIFLLLSIVSHVLLYTNDDAVKEIVLRSGAEGTAKTSLAVIKKITNATIKGVSGVKCRKCAVVSNDYGIRLKVWIVVKDRDMEETEELVRAYLDDAFFGALKFKFFAIDINLKKLETKHKVDKAAIDKRMEEKKAETATQPEEVTQPEQAEEPAQAEPTTERSETTESNVETTEEGAANEESALNEESAVNEESALTVESQETQSNE